MIALVAALLTSGIFSNNENNQKNEKLILAPQKGAIFEVMTKDNQYTLYKVENIEGDSAFIRFSKFVLNKITGLADLKSKGKNPVQRN